MLKKLILIAAGILVAKAVVEVAAEENEKVSSVVETTKSYVRKVVNKLTNKTINLINDVIKFVDDLNEKHPHTCKGMKLGVVSGGLTTFMYYAFVLGTEFIAGKH